MARWRRAGRAIPLMMFLAIGPSVFYGSSGTAAAATAQLTVPPAGLSAHVAKPAYYVTPAGRRVAATAAGADAADSIPVYEITSTNYGSIPDAHRCVSLGSYGSATGVACSDLYANQPVGGLDIVIPVSEAYCQDGSAYPQCADVLMQNELAQGNGAISTPHAAILCGHELGPCVNGGRNTGQGIYTTISGCNTTPGTAWEFWTVDLAWVGAKSGIDLPGDHWVYLASNWSSNHVIICVGD
jgi:hypothetical protein